MLAWRTLPVRLAATLAAGLPEDSRSRRKLSGEAATTNELMQASIVDALHRLEWRLCGSPGEAPASLVQMLLGSSLDLETPSETPSEIQSFATPTEFEAAMRAAEGGEV